MKWSQLSLRGAFLCITLCAIALAWFAMSFHRGIARAMNLGHLRAQGAFGSRGYWLESSECPNWHSFLSWLANGRYCAPIVEMKLSPDILSESEMELVNKFSELESLDFAGASLTDSHLSALTNLPNLKAIGLNDTMVSDTGLCSIARCSRRLSVVNCYATPVGNRGFAAALELPSLQKADFSYTSISGCEELSGVRLEELYLNYSNADDSLIVSLARCRNLRILEVSGTQITSKSVATFVTFSKLTRLSLVGTNIKAIDCERLRERLPECQIILSEGPVQ